MDGRGGSSMRLNFSGVGEDDIREGVRRIGKVVREQVGLYGTLTGVEPAESGAGAARAPARATAGAGRRRAREGARAASASRRPAARAARRSMSRVAVLKGGRSLERDVSLRSGARVEAALERLGHDVAPIDVGHDLVARLRELQPDVAFVALHGHGGEDGTVQELLEVLGIPYTGSGVLAAATAWTRSRRSGCCASPASPRRTSTPSPRPRSRSWARRRRCPRSRRRSRFPIVVKPARQVSALGIKFASTPADVPAAIVAAFSYDDRVLLERHVAGRDLAVSVLERTDGPEALPVVEAVPRDRGLLRLRGAL